MTRRLTVTIALAAAFFIPRAALAGPPLLCFPFDIGAARSLPIGTGGWHAVDPRYDASHLVDDTLALLAPETPIVVRMETLRRATLYAAKSPAIAAALLDRLQQRASTPAPSAPVAVFDFGYLVETYKQASYGLGMSTKIVQGIDGYSLVEKAAQLHDDPAVEFALAVMTRDRTHGIDVYRAHLARTVAAAKTDASIARNLKTQFAEDLSSR